MENEDKQNIHLELLAAQKIAYTPSGLTGRNFVKETESEDYGAFDFEMNDRRIKFRVGKITPTKIGQFVTLWKRIGRGPILPYDMDDPVDLFVISVRNSGHFGQFIFPKAVLYEKGIVSKDRRGGKRAMRIYPPWDIAENRQAKNTQAWQLLYFFEIHPNASVDIIRVQKLFLLTDNPEESHQVFIERAMECPPSTVNICPVIQEDSSVARKRAVDA